MRYVRHLTMVALTFATVAPASAQTAVEPDRTVLPMPFPPFEGVIGRTYKESVEDWPKLPTPPDGAPNVVVILLDDVGYGQTSTFGGPVPTPALDALADEGLRFTRFHTTAICGPSRAALITGRNHHNAGSGFLAEWATGFPSYDNMIPRSTATMGAILKYNGYATSWFGKNHNTPDWESSVAGPFDRWPTGMGFDYFYGFIGGETHQYYPVLFENTSPVEPGQSPAEGYHFMTDMTDKAIDWMRYTKSVAPQKPFLMYFAPGAAHAPHQPPKEWRDRFAGTFDDGWDAIREHTFARQKEIGVIPADAELTARPEWARNWASLDDQQRHVYSKLMENFAGYLAFTDHEIGRLLDAIRALPDAENTMVIYIVGDNGASSEGGFDGTINEVKSLSGFPTDLDEVEARLDDLGGPDTEPHYPVEWAWAGNAPFQWVKQVASHLGGARNPMVITWPARIHEKGGVRTQFTHLIDVLPTILEAANIPAPTTVDGIAQKPMDGTSFLGVFDDSAAPEVRTRQYFEVFSNRSIYADGWKANAQHTLPWRQDLAPGNWENDRWELYHLSEDYSEARDLASEMPDKLAAMKAIFDDEAEKNHVYPLDDRGTGRLAVPKPTPSDPARRHFVFYPGATRLPETAAPNTKNKSHTISARIEMPESGGEGVILAAGGSSAGFALYVKDGRLVYHYNWFDEYRPQVVSSKPLPAGPSDVRMEFVYAGAEGELGKGGTATLFIDDEPVGSVEIDRTVAARFGIDTFGVGEDSGAPVSTEYLPPYRFTGKIDEVVVDLE
ncbi:arylsulfatase [Acuticoccus sediminis]|uniref:Arylsulfatase n=1 Tax=Acuticoccus sediminis TaxID=2184697 RepID=A0A8B2NS26_9HYPH|nr:arylsulfatase [Acuticoccus sediminis]RAI00869.1 arylsulfatase [Acuticoccus sediminis]